MKEVMSLMIPAEWAIRGVAVLAFDPTGKIIMVEETEDKPEYGKYAGMITIPMETMNPGEMAVEAAVRGFGEEIGEECAIRYPIGFFEIPLLGRRDRVGIIAFFGELTGRSMPREKKGVKAHPGLTEASFQDTNPFEMRPQNLEIYADWKKLSLQVKGSPAGWAWAWRYVRKLIPPGARAWLPRE